MSDHTRHVHSPSRGGAPPPKMAPLTPAQPAVAGAAWHAVLIGRAHDEVAKITAQAALLLGTHGSTVQPTVHQEITDRDGQRITACRWAHATLAALAHAGLRVDQLTLRHDSATTATPVEGEQLERGNFPSRGTMYGRPWLPNDCTVHVCATGDRPGSLSVLHSRARAVGQKRDSLPSSLEASSRKWRQGRDGPEGHGAWELENYKAPSRDQHGV